MFYIQWHITDRCNLRCLHCYQGKYSRDNDLEWSRLQLIADNLISTMKLWDKRLKIALTGGEPFLKKELWKICDYLNNSPYVSSLNIITNGTLIDKSIISQITKFQKLKEIYISLDGITSNTNDSIRQNGSFERAMEAIKLLSSSSISVIIMLTLLKRNIPDAMGLFEFARFIGVKGYILERFFPLGQGEKLKNEVVSASDLNGIYQHIFKTIDETYIKEEMVKYRAIYVSFEKGKPELYGAECIAGRDGLAILPSGLVLPCRRFTIPIGNLLEEALSEIWKKSEVLNKIRDKKNLKGRCAKCKIADCYGCRAMTLALTGNYLQEDPHCLVF